MLQLYSILRYESLAKDDVLARLREIDRDSAIAQLIGLHNEGKIELRQWHFHNLARDLGIELRSRGSHGINS